MRGEVIRARKGGATEVRAGEPMRGEAKRAWTMDRRQAEEREGDEIQAREARGVPGGGGGKASAKNGAGDKGAGMRPVSGATAGREGTRTADRLDGVERHVRSDAA